MNHYVLKEKHAYLYLLEPAGVGAPASRSVCGMKREKHVGASVLFSAHLAKDETTCRSCVRVLDAEVRHLQKVVVL